MIEIRLLNQYPLRDYQEACKITQGINVFLAKKPADEVDYWVKQIIANHSTIKL